MTEAASTMKIKNRLASRLVALGALLLAAAGASTAAPLESANATLSDQGSLQRGAALYFNYCSACHTLKYVRYSRLGEDLGIDAETVEKNLLFTGGKIGDLALNAMPAEDAVRWFGQAPPDLSLVVRSKSEDWLYTYLRSFYLDPTRPLGWNNTLFPNVSMPNVLWELQGLQVAGDELDAEGIPVQLEMRTPGRQTPAQFEQTVRDLTAFLAYVSEPAALKRTAMGVWVLAFLAFFTLLAWLLKREYWTDVH